MAWKPTTRGGVATYEVLDTSWVSSLPWRPECGHSAQDPEMGRREFTASSRGCESVPLITPGALHRYRWRDSDGLSASIQWFLGKLGFPYSESTALGALVDLFVFLEDNFDLPVAWMPLDLLFCSNNEGCSAGGGDDAIARFSRRTARDVRFACSCCVFGTSSSLTCEDVLLRQVAPISREIGEGNWSVAVERGSVSQLTGMVMAFTSIVLARGLKDAVLEEWSWSVWALMTASLGEESQRRNGCIVRAEHDDLDPPPRYDEIVQQPWDGV